MHNDTTTVQLLDLTLPTPEQNLALDEALLDQAENEDTPGDVLRLWESPQPLVVVGRASRLAAEVNLAACQENKIPILRRCSGGTAVVGGPGCLMYAVVLAYRRYPHLRAVDQAHLFVMQRMRAALSTLVHGIELKGSCDLTLGQLKFSGNSLRCKRRNLLYHGTVLYNFPLQEIQTWLGQPPREPDYRHGRSHAAFLTNLPSDVPAIRAAIQAEWKATPMAADWPRAQTSELVQRQYSQDAWNRRL